MIIIKFKQIKKILQHILTCNNIKLKEIYSANAMILPSIICMYFMHNYNLKYNIKIRIIGCILHLPFSYMLHIHRALYEDSFIRKLLFKLDVTFIHVQSLFTGFSWNLKTSNFELYYHLLSIVHILVTQNYTKHKKIIISVICGIGVLLSSFGKFYENKILWLIAILFWLISFIVHITNYSSILFHILLVVPQLCMII